MGNTSASQKDRSASAPRAAKDLNDLLPALRERFEELAGLPAPPVPLATATLAESRAEEVSAQQRIQQHQEQEDSTAAAAAAAATLAPAGGGGGGQEKRYVMFDDWSELPGPRGAQLAKRLYGVLDANGDGKLDFEVCVYESFLHSVLFMRAVSVSLDVVYDVTHINTTPALTAVSRDDLQPLQEFASAACLLKGSPDEDKLARECEYAMASGLSVVVQRWQLDCLIAVRAAGWLVVLLQVDNLPRKSHKIYTSTHFLRL